MTDGVARIPAPKSRLDPRSAVFLVVANMIGAGVFTSSGFALAGLSAEHVLVAWVIGGVLATTGALCYGALGRRFPHSGGEYELLRRTLGPLPGFLAGVVSLVAGFSAPIAIAATIFEGYLGRAFHSPLPPHVLGSVVIVFASLLHARGLRIGARAQDALVVVKLSAIAALVVAGSVVLLGRGLPDVSASAPLAFDLGAFAVTCVYVSFAYSGWNAASYLAGEIDNAKQNLTRVLLCGTWITMAVYLALNVLFVYSAPREVLAGQAEIGLVAAHALGGRAVAVIVALVVALAALTSITAMTMAGPRVYTRMAEDGFLPARLARSVAHRHSIALQAGLALVLLWATPLERLMQWTGWTLWASSAATIVGLVVLRRREGAVAVPIAGWPVVPLLYLAVSIAIGGFAFKEHLAGGAVVIVALVLSLLWYAIAVERARRTRR